MSATVKKSLVWFRNDLRTEDHQGLKKAIESGNQVIAYYTFNPDHFKTLKWGFKKTERYRAQFLIESVSALQRELKALNISLIIDLKTPGESLPELIQQHRVIEIYLQQEWTQEEIEEENAVAEKIDPSIVWIRHYEQFLFHPDALPYSLSSLPEVFGVFRKKCEKELKINPLESKLNPLPLSNLVDTDQVIPTLADLDLDSFEKDYRSAFPNKGGTTAAMDRLDHYFWKTKKLSYYKNTRNGLLGEDYSSKFSPWLANGSISPKMIYWEIKRYEKEVKKNQSTYWLFFELVWRDYFKYISLKHGNKIFKIGGILERDYHWRTDEALFKSWASGNSTEPFVNANMIELNNTGWMSNRGRQNVASYLAKEINVDWRIGAAYFESLLLDYDVHSNYGNWMYVAGVGNDPRDRKFDVQWQAERYDSNGKFQNLWLQKTLF